MPGRCFAFVLLLQLSCLFAKASLATTSGDGGIAHFNDLGQASGQAASASLDPQKDLVFAITADGDRELLVHLQTKHKKGVHTYLTGNFVEEKVNTSELTYLQQGDSLLSLEGKPHIIRAAMAPLNTHRASGGAYKWMLYGDDDTLWNVDAIADLLAPYDHTLPYLITDCIIYTPQCNDSVYNDPRINWSRATWTDHVDQHTSPRCLPCHFQASPGWGQPSLQAVPGCPCTREAACAASSQCCLEKGVWHGTPYGGGGMVLSAGLFAALDHKELVHCIKEGVPAYRCGDNVFTECLRIQGIHHTDPGHVLYGQPRLFNANLHGFNTLAAMWACYLGNVDQSKCKAMFGSAVSLHHGELRKLLSKPDKGQANVDFIYTLWNGIREEAGKGHAAHPPS